MANQNFSSTPRSGFGGALSAISCGNDKAKAFAFLYSVFHLPDVVKPEYSVFNPNPTQHDPRYIIPQDTYLFDEQKKLAGMDLEDMIKECTQLVEQKGVPSINVIVGLDTNDTIRFSASAIFDVICVGGTDYEIPIMCSVTGGTEKKNQELLQKILKQAELALNDAIERLQL